MPDPADLELSDTDRERQLRSALAELAARFPELETTGQAIDPATLFEPINLINEERERRRTEEGEALNSEVERVLTRARRRLDDTARRPSLEERT